ncbi:hypothetical protein GCM10027589_01300 [Actinocorallia lasiicapitis]
MTQPSMRITPALAMRVRDVSRPAADEPQRKPPEPVKPRRGERRRLSKRGKA